jgi:hypothetical protein
MTGINPKNLPHYDSETHLLLKSSSTAKEIRKSRLTFIKHHAEHPTSSKYRAYFQEVMGYEMPTQD